MLLLWSPGSVPLCWPVVCQVRDLVGWCYALSISIFSFYFQKCFSFIYGFERVGEKAGGGEFSRPRVHFGVGVAYWRKFAGKEGNVFIYLAHGFFL
jgi:hypothetical protein